MGYDKAIVSPHAGTTRDAVEGSIEIDGITYNLVDTAGIREKADEIEEIGISIAKKVMQSADVIVYVCEGAYVPLEGVDEDDERLIKVFNKCDISPAASPEFDVMISARTGENIDKLKQLMARKAVGGASSDGAFIIEERHREALVRADQSLKSAIAAVGVYPLDIISLDISAAWSALGEITGETANEQIIDTVFKKILRRQISGA